MGVGTDLNGHLNCMMPCLVDHLVQREAGTHVRSPGSVHNTCIHAQAQQVVRHYRSLVCRSPSQVGCAPSSAVTPGTFRRWSCFWKRHQPPQQLSRRKLQPQLQMLPPGGCDYHRIPGQASSRISRALLPAGLPTLIAAAKSDSSFLPGHPRIAACQGGSIFRAWHRSRVQAIGRL